MSDPTPPTPPAVATKPYKAYAAFAFTLLGLLWANIAGLDTLSDLTVMEWLSIIVPTLLTTGAVYGLTNPVLPRPPAGAGAGTRRRGPAFLADAPTLLYVLLAGTVVVGVVGLLFLLL